VRKSSSLKISCERIFHISMEWSSLVSTCRWAAWPLTMSLPSFSCSDVTIAGWSLACVYSTR
jgi:hypothetical protein